MQIAQAFLELRNSLPDDPAVLRRLDRGYDIARQQGGYAVKEYLTGKWAVERLSTSLLEDNSMVYHVDKQRCSCPDFEQAPAGLCKHRLAIKLICLMEGK